MALLGLICVFVAGYYLVYTLSIPQLRIKPYPPAGPITEIDAKPGIDNRALQPGDTILAFGGIPIAEYLQPGGVPINSLLMYEDYLPVTVEREGQRLSVLWRVTKPDDESRWLRSIQFLPPIGFLAAAVLTALFLHSTDERVPLLVMMFALNALWAAAGTVGFYNVFLSDFAMRAALWLLVPVTLHFGWIFPHPLHRLPPWIGHGLYLLGVSLALAENFRLLPDWSYGPAFLIITLGLTLLLLAHLIWQPGQRRAIGLFLAGLSIVMTLSAAAFLLGTIQAASQLTALAVFIFALLPAAFLFSIFRRLVPGFEVRTNQTAIIVSFAMLVGLIVATGNLFLARFAAGANYRQPLEIVLVILAIVFFVFIYPLYARWMQQHLLKMTLPRENLLQQFSRMIVTSLEINHLAAVFRDHLAPSLLIRQIALLRLNEHGEPTVIMTMGVQESHLPTADQIRALLTVTGRSLTPPLDASLFPSWVRVALALAVEGRPDGICLLGRRDPSDVYSTAEIQLLQSLTDQAALALRNIAQAERLHAFHQANIKRLEGERQGLARELHDDVLGQLALMMMNAPENGASETFVSAYEKAANRVRAIINGLRPAMLHYGLAPAIDELCDNLREQFNQRCDVHLAVSGREVRLPLDVEMHIYRILQEACQNGLRHGKADRLIISGSIAPDQVTLEVRDNGIGFAANGQLDLAWLLRQRHFGLANIYERAALIGADVQIHSRPGHGARVSVQWRA